MILQIGDMILYLLDDRNKFVIAFSRRIGQSPIIIKGSADKGTTNVTAHRNRDIGHWDFIKGLAVLGLLHINAVKLLHKPNGVLIDLRLGFCACGIEFELIAALEFAERFCNLTAAGVMHADKRYLLFHLKGHLAPMH